MIKTILLTGPTGFLGSNLLEALVREKYDVVILKRSFSNTWRINHLLPQVKSYDIDREPIEKAFGEQTIDAVIHTATNYGRNHEKFSEIVGTNLMFGLKLAETAAAFHTGVFFNTDTLQGRNISGYSLAKKQFLEWLKFISESGQLRIVNFRIEHMYGPRDDRTKFVSWLLEEMQETSGETALTPGDQKRDFIYVTDVADAYLLLLRHAENVQQFSEFDIGTGNQIAVREFVMKLKDTLEKIRKKPVTRRLAFGARNYRTGEPMVVEENLAPLFAHGWKPSVNLSEGLDSVVKEFITRRKDR